MRSYEADPFLTFDSVLHDSASGYPYTKRKALEMHRSGGAKPVPDPLVSALFRALDSKGWAVPGFPTPNNWRWRVEADFERDKRELLHSDRGEVRLERDLVRAAGLAEWTFQMSTMSGVIHPHAHARRAIDLVHRVAPGHFQFIELKTTSNSPLFAAFEILRYGLTWCHSRLHSALIPEDERTDGPVATSPAAQHQILRAHKIELIVLAPGAFYELPLNGTAQLFRLTEFVESINRGLTELVGKIQGVEAMTLSFRSFKSQQALIDGATRGSVGELVAS